MGSIIDKLQFLWNQSFYAEPMFLILDCIAIYLIYHSQKTKQRILFLWYTISALLLFIGTDVIFVTLGRNKIKPWEILNIIFSLIELTVFYLYYQTVLNKIKLTRLIKFSKYLIVPILVLMSVSILLADQNNTYKLTGYYSGAIYFILLIPPVFYFYEVFKENKELDIKISFLSIWLFTYCVITILPTILEGRLINIWQAEFYWFIRSFHYIALSVLCSLLVVICRGKNLSKTNYTIKRIQPEN